MICRICNRPLTNPRHVQAGMGPVCAKKLGLSFSRPPRQPRPLKPKRRPRATQDVVVLPLPFEEAVLS